MDLRSVITAQKKARLNAVFEQWQQDNDYDPRLELAAGLQHHCSAEN